MYILHESNIKPDIFRQVDWIWFWINADTLYWPIRSFIIWNRYNSWVMNTKIFMHPYSVKNWNGVFVSALKINHIPLISINTWLRDESTSSMWVIREDRFRWDVFSGKAEIFMSVSWGHTRVSSALWDYQILSLLGNHFKKTQQASCIRNPNLHVIKMKGTDVWLGYF